MRRIIAVLLTLAPLALAAQYNPIAVTGFNHDVVAEGTGTSSLATTTREMDAITPSNFVMCTQQFAAANNIPAGYGLPNNGTVVSGNRLYQMVSFGTGSGTSNNALYLLQNENGVLTLTTPGVFSNISLLGTATEGNAFVTAVLRYTDGTFQTVANRVLPDWIGGANPMLQGFGRIKRINGPFGAGTYEQAPNNPRLYAIDITVNCTKTLASISITNTSSSSSRAFIFAVSGMGYTPPVVAPVITPASCGQSNGSIALGITGSYTYSWNTTPVQNGVTALNLPGGSYTATITNSAGCVSTYTATVPSTPAFTLAASAQPAAICAGGSSTLTAVATGGTISTYQWEPGNINSSQATVSPAATTNYMVWAQDINGCRDTAYAAVTVNQPPTSSFTAVPATVCSARDTVVVTYTGNAGAAATYNWNFGGATVLSGSGSGPYTLIYNTAGNTAISLTVDNGCISQPTQQPIQVNASPAASLSLNNNSICAGLSVTVSFTGSAPVGSTFTWNFGGGNVQQGTAAGPYTVVYNNTSATTVSVLVNNSGCTDTASLPMVVHPIPSAAFSVAPAAICAGETVVTTYTGGASATATYNWNLNGGTATPGPGAGEQTIAFADAGTKTITLQVTENGCTSTVAQQTVRVDAPVVASFSVSADTICAGSNVTVTFTGTAPATASYNWNFGSRNVVQGSGAGPYNVRFSTSGSQVISLSLSNLTCTSPVVSQPVYVQPMPVPAFTATPVSGCAPLQVQFNNTSTQATSFTWRISDGTSYIDAAPSHLFNRGTYSVTLVAAAGNCIDSAVRTNYINVAAPPVARFTASPGTAVAIPLSLAGVSFTNQSQHATQYRWNFGDGTTSQLANPFHQYSAIGSYTVTLIASNGLGCTDSFSMQYFRIIPDTAIHIPNSFSPNRDGINDTWVIPGLAGYPQAKVFVYDRYGQVVAKWEHSYRPWDGRFNGKDLPLATYYYIVQLRREEKPIAGWLLLIR